MPTTAPSPNCGFTTSGSPGWVRLWLVNDDPNGPGADLWAIPGQVYPLAVAAYELMDPEPAGIDFDERDDLGGYTRSKGLDESPYAALDANVGAFASSNGACEINAVAVTLAAGEFYAGNVASVGDGAPYLFLVIP